MPQSISAEPLARMIRSITFQKRTGVLRVKQLGGRSAEWGEFYFENGSLVRARTERATGKAALRHISEWKQITCAFQSTNRPYPAAVLGAASVQEPEGESSQAHTLPQTDPLARVPALMDTERHTSLAGRPFQAGERSTHPLDPRQAEDVLSASSRPSVPLIAENSSRQPLVLHGTKLEAYMPVPPATPARSVQHWTIHLAPEARSTVQPHRLPSPARLLPLSGEKVPPGRMAVFKACSTVSTAQAIQHMERHARLVFILLDGRRTIQDIARLIHQTEHDVEQILVNLTRRGYTYYVCG